MLTGPSGSGKARTAQACLQAQKFPFKFISYAQLLVSEGPLYESPRLKLLRLLQTAELDGCQFVLLAHIEDFLEDATVWLILQEYLRSSSSFRFISTVSSASRWLPKLRNIFSFVLEVEESLPSHKPIDDSWQLAMPSKESKLTLDTLYGVPARIKEALLKMATFQLEKLNVRGVLLSGPPGTGKTRLAAALAGSLGDAVKVYNLAASDLLRAEIGQSEERIREAFRAARATNPSLIFFDEIEALFPERDPGHLGTVLDQLVAEFDAMEREDGQDCRVFVLAATNFPEKLNHRLRQAGRLEIELEIGLPGPEERAEILEKELLRRDDRSIDWDSFPDSTAFMKKLVADTEGFTPAKIVKIILEARRKSKDGVLRPSSFE